MKRFLDDDFMLSGPTAEKLYFDYAKNMPIFDYHCHLSPDQIATNYAFSNLTDAWLRGDHYKWRALRANGVPEDKITGKASDRDKFQAWAETVPATIGNPLYHWTHMELKRPFGVDGIVLNGETASRVWDTCNDLLAQPAFTTQGILSAMNVRFVCTTDDPVDDLRYHKAIAAAATVDFKTKVLPAFRPDKALAVADSEAFNAYVERLAESENATISNYADFIDVLKRRFHFFHENGARISDHALQVPVCEAYRDSEIRDIFRRLRNGRKIDKKDRRKFQTAVLEVLAGLYSTNDWVMQLHIGALRNNNSRMFGALGPDAGFDSMDDQPVAQPLGAFLDRVESTVGLPKTIIYNLNAVANDTIAAMIGNFQDGKIKGKMQFGSGWWYNDQKDGMLKQMTSLANIGLLSRFVGMLTDSRSFLSFPRHDYFRRILCSLVGGWVENGEAPNDLPLLGSMVQDISWNNAQQYFGID